MHSACFISSFVTPQVQFSPDGNFLYSGARQDASLHCWDVRYTSSCLYTMQRDSASTNQRIGFDIEPCGERLFSGGCDGCVQVGVGRMYVGGGGLYPLF